MLDYRLKNNRMPLFLGPFFVQSFQTMAISGPDKYEMDIFENENSVVK